MPARLTASHTGDDGSLVTPHDVPEAIYDSLSNGLGRLMPCIVREGEIDDEDRLTIRLIASDFERARMMGKPEPDWLPEKTLAWYAEKVGLDRNPAPVDPVHVRIRVRTARRTRRLSQGELAKKIGLSQSALSLIETGKRTIHLYQLCAIAKALNVSMEYLVRPPDVD